METYTSINRYETFDLFKNPILVVSTIHATDVSRFETGISHPCYNDRHFIVVEEYLTLDDAHAGHNKWVEIMTKDSLPAVLRDVSSYHSELFSERPSYPFTITVSPVEPLQLGSGN